MSTGVEVFVFKGGRFLGSRCFSQPTIVIGSAAEATLRLKDPDVAARHAIVRVEGERVVIADNRSATGVTVNGERISVRQIGSLDEVAIGPFRVKMTVLGLEHHDTGFGDEDSRSQQITDRGGVGDEAATRVRGQEVAPEAPQATVPRARRPRFDDDDNDAAAAGPQRAAPRPARQSPAWGTAATAGSPQRRGAARGEEDLDLGRAATLDVGRAPTHDAPLFPDARPHENEATAAESHQDVASRFDVVERHGRPTEREALDTEEHLPGDLPDATDEHAVDELPAFTADGEGGEDEHDEEDEDFVEPFSLLENVVRERFKERIEAEPHAVAEVIRYKEGQLLDLIRASAGDVVATGPDDFRMVEVFEDGKAQLFFEQGSSGTLVSNGKARRLKSLCVDKYLVRPEDHVYGVVIQEGDYAQVVREEAGYLVRFVRPPLAPKPERGFKLNAALFKIFAASVAVHAVVLVGVMLIAGASNALPPPEPDKPFAKVQLPKDLPLEKKEEPKPEEKKEEPEKPEKPEKPEPQPKIKPRREPVQRTVRRTPERAPRVTQEMRQQARAQAQQQKQVSSVLAALKPAAGPGRSDLASIKTNISAVRAPSGTSSNYKIGGVIGKIPGNSVRLGSMGGGGGRDTRAGSQLLRGSSVGKVTAAAGTGTRVRGRVGRAPTRVIGTKGGSLSREAIQAVVARHMAQIQGCYERVLISNPGLAGKIVFDWVISPGGSVSSVRMASSSMRNPSVATCIMGVIRTFQFPKPVGGSVDVRYPFVFRVQGF